MFGQTFEYHDLAVVALLVILEGVLSIDNALVLGLLAKRLPPHQRQRALMYGLVGAFVFRVIAIIFAQLLLGIEVVKLIGGGYLLFVAGKYFLEQWFGTAEEQIVLGDEEQPVLVHADDGSPLSAKEEEEELEARIPVPAPELEVVNGSSGRAANGTARAFAKFWPTVVVIELTDIAFAVDSILAAIALVGPKEDDTPGLHPKLWVVVLGGMLGVLLMRVAAAIFIRLLEKFPRFETSAYLLVSVIGLKLVADWWFNEIGEEHPVLDFHSLTSPAFWFFWVTMLLCFLVGFIPKARRQVSHEGS
jgi:YkoY family integral membrane protein